MVIAVVFFAAMTAFLFLVRALVVRLAAAGPRETASIKPVARPVTVILVRGSASGVRWVALPPPEERDRIRRPIRHGDRDDYW